MQDDLRCSGRPPQIERGSRLPERKRASPSRRLRFIGGTECCGSRGSAPQPARRWGFGRLARRRRRRPAAASFNLHLLFSSSHPLLTPKPVCCARLVQVELQHVASNLAHGGVLRHTGTVCTCVRRRCWQFLHLWSKERRHLAVLGCVSLTLRFRDQCIVQLKLQRPLDACREKY